MIIKKLPLQWLLLLSLNLTLGITAILMQPTTQHAPTQINERLSDIQSQLGSLQQAIKEPAEKLDINTISQDFKHLETLINDLKSKHEGQLNQLVVESQTQLSSKLDAMNSAIDSLDKKQHPIKYLPISALPFTVISIDSIQQVSVASVTYDYKTIPLENSDALAGWTVLSVDFGKQKIELENASKERVVIAMEGAKQHA